MILLDPDATIPVDASPSTPSSRHRGASGYRPEHTLAAYALAIRQCADFIEPDIVIDQGRRPRRPARERDRRHHRRRAPPGVRRPQDDQDDRRRRSVTGWFTEDFTLAELRTLRAKERLPERAAGQHRVRRHVPDPDPRPRCSTWPATPAPAAASRSA